MCRTHQSREFWGAELCKLVDARKIPGKAYRVTFWTMNNGDDQAISGNTFVPAKLIEIAKYRHTTYTFPSDKRLHNWWENLWNSWTKLMISMAMFSSKL